jgi:diguanylate cyclase (GGDEF)-like protein
MSGRLSKNNRLLLLIAVMAVSSILVGGLVYVWTSAQDADLDETTSRLSTALALANGLSGAVDTEEAALGDYVLSHSALALKRFNDAVDTETRLSTRRITATIDLPQVAGVFDIFEADSRDWRAQVATPAITAVGRSDQKWLDEFAYRFADDHARLDTDADRITKELAVADAGVAAKRAAVENATTVGVVVAFAFLVMAFGVALAAVRRFGHRLERDAGQSLVLNRFTEVTSFAADDREVASANLVALNRLARPDASVTHILNRSLDRAVPEASTGDAIAEILPLRALDRCAGVVRGTMYVADDLSDELSVHCPVYPASSGTLACIPLVSGESVGAVHLYWRRPNGLPLERRPNIGRITEHAALAIGNRRLLAALHGQANTDPRTGLANSRAFDVAVESALGARAAHETVSVLMLDVDHFKAFNDKHGHPAGDEALRAFGGVLRSCMRDGDLAARYGGEEFAVLLPGNDRDVVSQIAERIRMRIESTIIAVAPGVTDHITASIGIASAPDHGTDRVALLRLADEALYRAKDAGRNRVVWVEDRSSRPNAAGPVSRRGRRRRPDAFIGPTPLVAPAEA